MSQAIYYRQCCLDIVPASTAAKRQTHISPADPKDLSILAAAFQEKCSWLVTFNGRHFPPGHPALTVFPPGAFMQRVRHLLAQLQ